MRHDFQIFRSLVSDAMSPPPLALAPGTACGAAVARMAALAAPCAAVTDASGRPIGLLTDQDVARRIAFQVPAGAPVEAVMTRSVPSVQASDRLYHAVARMRRLRLRHLVVTDRDGRAVGMLDLDAALAATAGTLVRRIERLAHEDSMAGWRAIKQQEAVIARDMLDDHIPATEIQEFLTDINGDLYGQIVDRALAAMADEGWGKPPVAFTVLLMGSGGRGENFLDPDQDNGFVLDDYPDEAHGSIDRFFLELAERMTRDLDAIGIPFCAGAVMATNPLWRKSLTQWREQTELWARRRSGGATLLADIFFDFQPVHGDATMAATLRRHVCDLARKSRLLLQSMAHDDTVRGVALNLFGRLATEGVESIHRGRIELKMHARLPLVGCIRLLALAQGIEETPTLARIRRLGEAGVLVQGDVDGLVDAHRCIAHLILRQQVTDIEAGRLPGVHVEADRLTAQERNRLHEALRAIDRLRKRTQIDLIGQQI